MDFSLFLRDFSKIGAAVGFFVIFRKFRSYQENKEIDSSSSSSSTSSPPPSSLSISSVPPSATSHNWTYDVFPSFRGEDVRNNILSHIKREFERKGITPFNDNGIKRGESIGPELISAIKGSKIAIILLSENYASSKWCLDELVEIMKCREELGQTVMAIFYKVDPSDVKKLTGDFGKVFKKTCAGKTKEDIGRWKQALGKVATIAGYHINNWDNEAAMIEKIAMDISNKLINYAPLSDFDGLVGMRAHMEKMEPFLLLGSDEVRMIGIWGPSGIGKSTIARVLFSNYSSQFQLSVFMNDIKRRYPRLGYNEYSMKLNLQKEFLSQIIDQKDIKIQHLGVVQDRLKDQRVLVVLDDVDQLVHLDAMAKETQWFGPGSRIIITTQDKKVLNAHGINHIYEVEFPRDNEDLAIFCMNAFGQKSPYDGFEELAWEVTRLAGNLPLGLSVMGSHFKGVSKKDWEEELPVLRTRLDGEIESALKFSYDALCEEDQALFLHIAMFFNESLYFYGIQSETLEAYLAESFVGVKSRLRVLAEKSLISLGRSGKIEMHNLLVRLGREIVRKQSPNEPGKRQFLVDARDICQVLCNDSVDSGSVIGIDLLLSNSYLKTKLKVSDGAFKKMSNVQFLRIESDDDDVDDDDFTNPIPDEQKSWNYLPPNLRILHWIFFPMTCLPSNFNAEFLVEIKLRYSNLEKLWEGTKTIRYLKWMDLSYSRKLKELPDLSTATNLCELKLEFCSSLVELHFSIGSLNNLEVLKLEGCSNLKSLPFNLTSCSSLKSFPEISTNIETDRIVELELSDTTQDIAPWVKEMSRLQTLIISGCTKLVSLPRLPDSLKLLKAANCESLERLDCSFNKTKFYSLGFVNCFKLNEEARDLLIKTSTEILVVFPAEKVPTYFTYRATRSSLSMKWNGPLPTDSRFKVCILLANQGDPRNGAYCIKNKLNGGIIKSGDSDKWYELSPTLTSTKHLFVYELGITVTSAELVFEFIFGYENWELEECGVLPPETVAPSC